MDITISAGFADHERDLVATMYWQAFGAKLGRVMGPDERGIAFIRDALDPAHGICARDQDGTLIGVVGFKTFKGALVASTWRDMAANYGWVGATWRAALLSLLERDIENERFLMDGIFVRDTARGHGVGTLLLNAVADEARKRNYRELRLDVINTNPSARRLYERHGFTPLPSQSLGWLRFVFGFESATPMTLDLSS